MQEKYPQEITLNSTHLQRHFGPVIQAMHKEGQRVIIERGGLPVFVMVSMADLKKLRALDQSITEKAA